MQINQLRYFATLVEKHSFTEAARECFITQSALSQQIKALELELNISLLNRHGKTFTITPAGKLLYQRSLRILKDISELADRVIKVGNNTGSSLRVGLLSSMDIKDLPEVLKEEVLCRTGLTLDIIFGSHDELYDAFGRGSISAFVSDERRLTLRDSFQKIRLFSTKLYLEVSRSLDLNHSGLKKMKIDVRELERLQLLFVCSPVHIDDESRAFNELSDGDFTLNSAFDIEDGRYNILLAPNVGLVVDRSLLRGDYTEDGKISRYEIQNHGKTLKRHLCCYARNNMDSYVLDEFCHILMELSGHNNDHDDEHYAEPEYLTCPEDEESRAGPSFNASNPLPI